MEARKAIPPLFKLVAKAIELYNPKHKVLGILEQSAKHIEELGKEVGSTPLPPPPTLQTEIAVEPEKEVLPKVDPEKARVYTNKQAIKHIIAVEDHLKSDEDELCKACISEKHLPALEIYVQEGKSFCRDECSAYDKLRNIVRETKQAVQADFSLPVREQLAEEFRQVRKELSGYERTAKKITESLGEGD